LAVVCWLPGRVEGYVAGCTWHVNIVLTKDADKHDAPLVRNAMPRPPLVDITHSVRKLAVTGIRMDPEVGHTHSCAVESLMN